MAHSFLNRVKFSVTTAPGTGVFTQLSAVAGNRTMGQSGAVDGRVYAYVAEDPSTGNYEDGRGTWNALAGTLSRDVIVSSSNSDVAVNFANSNVQISIVMLGEEMYDLTGAYVSASRNIYPGGKYRVDTSTGGGAITLTLPAVLSKGDSFDFEDPWNTWGINNFTIARNGNTIMGKAEDLTVNAADTKFTLIYNGSDLRLL